MFLQILIMKLLYFSCFVWGLSVSSCKDIPVSFNNPSTVPIISSDVKENSNLDSPCGYLRSRDEKHTIGTNSAINSTLLTKFFKENPDFPTSFEQANKFMEFTVEDNAYIGGYCKRIEEAKTWEQIVIVKTKS
jgi:hypothetical protein